MLTASPLLANIALSVLDEHLQAPWKPGGTMPPTADAGPAAPKLDHPDVPAAPELLAVAPDPLVVLPTDEITDLTIQLWSTDRFPLMVNGASGITPAEHQAIRDLMRTFPSPASIDRLRGLGIRSVVVIRDRVRGTPFEGALSAPTGHLGIMRQEVGPDVLYTIE